MGMPMTLIVIKTAARLPNATQNFRRSADHELKPDFGELSDRLPVRGGERRRRDFAYIYAPPWAQDEGVKAAQLCDDKQVCVAEFFKRWACGIKDCSDGGWWRENRPT
jgi:hypothetical protein